jgi:hypothetical protein
MLGRVIHWFREARAWNAEHRVAWGGGVKETGDDGRSPFQRECERRVVEVLASRDLELRSRRLEPDPIPEPDFRSQMVVAEVPELGAEFWFYSDQTDISAPPSALHLEEWDARTPDEHCDKVVEFVRSLPRVDVHAAQPSGCSRR